MELPCRWLGLQEPRTTRRNEEMIRRHQCQGHAFLSAGAPGETPRSSGSLGARLVSIQSMPRLRHRFLLVCLRANLQHQQYVLYNTCSLHVGHRAYRFFFSLLSLAPVSFRETPTGVFPSADGRNARSGGARKYSIVQSMSLLCLLQPEQSSLVSYRWPPPWASAISEKMTGLYQTRLTGKRNLLPFRQSGRNQG